LESLARWARILFNAEEEASMRENDRRFYLTGTPFFSLLILIGVVLQAGCTVKRTAPAEKTRPESDISYFRYQKERLTPQIERFQDEETYWIEKVSFSSSMDSSEMTGYYYHPKTTDNPPTILIIPVLGGGYYFSKSSARYLVKRGMSCLRFERTTDPLDPQKGLHHTETVLRHAIIDIRRVVDWVVQRNPGNSTPIGVMGISMGAIVAALALQVEPRIGAGALILGGADIAAILAWSREDRVVRFREAVMQASRMSLDEFHDEAARIMVPVDALTYRGRADPNRILMVNGLFDRVIPSSSSKNLWEAMGRPLWFQMPTGHYSAALLLWHIRYRTFLHFQKVFAM
jgi:dienelactone hydrolase